MAYGKKRIFFFVLYLMGAFISAQMLVNDTTSTTTMQTQRQTEATSTPLSKNTHLCTSDRVIVRVRHDLQVGHVITLDVNCSNWQGVNRSYSIFGNSEVSGYFSISKNNNDFPILTVRSKPIKIANWSLYLNVSKEPFPFETLTILPMVIIVSAMNYPPVLFPPFQMVNIMENSPIGTSVTHLTAIDPENGEMTSYGIDLPPEVMIQFDPDRRDRIILVKTKEYLDADKYTKYKRMPFYDYDEPSKFTVDEMIKGPMLNFTIAVKDGLGLVGTANVSLLIVDLNDNGPVCIPEIYLKASHGPLGWFPVFASLRQYCNDSDFSSQNSRQTWSMIEDNCTAFVMEGGNLWHMGAISENVTSCFLLINVTDRIEPSFSTVLTVNITFCECSEDIDYMGTYWKATAAGRQNYSSCPDGFTGEVTRFCDDNGIYQPPVYNCTSNELTEILKEVNENVAFNSTKVLAQLVDATAGNSKNNGTLLVGDVDAVNAVMVKITDAISSHSDQVLDLTDPFLNVANNLLRENTTTTWTIKINKTGEGVNTLLNNVDRFMEKIVEVTNASNFSSTQFTKTNLYVKLGSTESCVNGIRFPDRKKKDKAIPEWTENTQDSLEILCNYDATIKAYSSVIYRNISNLIPLTTRMQRDSADRTGPIKLDASVISFSFLPRDERKLETPIQLTFQLFTKELVDPVCSFWTKEESSDRGYWSSEGCVLASYDRTEGIVVCKCDHLTNFAVLTSPLSISVGDHHIVLSVISMVGCIVSMVALFITVIVHIIFWRNVKSVRTIINVNLCCTLFVAYLLFLTGIDQTENQDACKAVAVLLHFVYLAAFIIMLVEGLSLAYAVFKPLSTRKPGIPLLISAYVVAVVIVCVSMGAVQIDGYGTTRFCWLSTETGLIWAFVGPVIFVILINIVIVVAVVYRMCGTAAMSKKTNKEKAKAGLRSVLVLMPIMGVTWLFGVFSINGDTLLFQYLFAIFNSLQGLFIFIFHCCMNSKIRKAFKRSRLGKRFISSASEAGPSKSATNKNTSNTDL